MAIETTCGGCGKQLSVGDEFAGRRARCPACGQIYTIPSPNAVPSAPPDLPSLPTSQSSPTSDSFAETTAGIDSAGSQPVPPQGITSNISAEQFWMRSTEGAEYGPVDRTTLDRWFNEGRVGPGYMIRQSETGNWQSAEIFKPAMQANIEQTGIPVSSNSSNPYAATVTGPPIGSYGPMYPKPDQSGLVLAFGILSWFICPIFGIVAWIMGNNGLKDIRLGLVDPANKGLMQAGYYLGMVHVILMIVCGSGYFVFVALAILAGTMN